MKDQLCNRGKTLEKKNERWFPELNNPQNFVNMEDGTFNVVPRNHIRRNINITNKESGVLGCRTNHDLFPARDHSERARAVRHSRRRRRQDGGAKTGQNASPSRMPPRTDFPLDPSPLAAAPVVARTYVHVRHADSLVVRAASCW